MKSFDERLATLRTAVEDPSAPGSRATIVKALKGKHGLMISVAAQAVGEDAQLLERSAEAFERLMHDAVKRDPQCQGKVAIARCLRQAETSHDEILLAGARHLQYEPVWGGRVDTAAQLRGICVMALVEGSHPRALVEAAHLLADEEVAARTAAARAIGCSGNAEVGEPLLRLRVEAGEEDSTVLAECLGALLQLAPHPSLSFVVSRLRSKREEEADAAALALGESRLDDALAPLCEQAERVVMSGRRGVVLLAIAMLRNDKAWAQLLEWIEDGPRGLASDALEALGTFAHDERLGRRMRAAVAARSDNALVDALAELFE